METVCSITTIELLLFTYELIRKTSQLQTQNNLHEIENFAWKFIC